MTPISNMIPHKMNQISLKTTAPTLSQRCQNRISTTVKVMSPTHPPKRKPTEKTIIRKIKIKPTPPTPARKIVYFITPANKCNLK